MKILSKNIKASFATCYIIILLSCKSKTETLLVNSWYCVKIDNLDPINKIIQTPADSLAMLRVQQALENLQWTFSENKEYQCKAIGINTAKGIYKIDEDNKILVLISTNNNIAAYHIINLTENELNLKTINDNSNITMHFKANN